MTLNLYALGSASHLFQQSNCHMTHITVQDPPALARPCLNEQLTQIFAKGTYCKVPFQKRK